MDTRDLFLLFLYLHIGGVMVGIGISFAFSAISRLGRAQPEQQRFAVGVIQHLTSRMVIPLAGLVLASGFAMIFTVDYDLFGTGWLLTSVVLFLASFSYSVLVQNPTLKQMLAQLDGEPRDPERMRQLGQRIRRGGIYLRVSALAILFLMVFKPF